MLHEAPSSGPSGHLLPKRRRAKWRTFETSQRCSPDVTYRSFNVASPISASTTEMIQKRTTTVDSFQPFCS